METADIEGISLVLAKPVSRRPLWIGQREAMDQLLAAWLILARNDKPLCPRIIGRPGLGKTTLALAAAGRLDKPVWVFQCTADTRPEDLLVTPVLGGDRRIAYHASPLVSAMLGGGIAVLDEGNRMSEKSWASLASLLDDRQMVESIVAGVLIPAHRDFRCAVTMNDDASTFEIPEYILSRLQPAIELGHPQREDEMQILRYNLPEAPEELVAICLGFLQDAHRLELPYSIRDGLNAIRYSQRLASIHNRPPASMFEQAVRQILGEEALNLEAEARRQRARGSAFEKLRLGDYFFDDDDPLNPDATPGDGPQKKD